MSVGCKHHNAIYLFHITPCFPCGTILFRTKPICSKCMCRLVIVHVFYILGGHIACGILSGFPEARTYGSNLAFEYDSQMASTWSRSTSHKCVSTRLGTCTAQNSHFYL